MSREEHNGRRRSRLSLPSRAPNLGYYIIVTDTSETEKNYLNGLKNSLPEEIQNRLVIKVLKTSTKDLISKCESFASKESQFRQLWIVFDRDEVPNFDQIIQTANAKGISVGWSNPCIEIWFYAYWGNMPSIQTSTSCCRNFSDTFRLKTGHEYSKSDPSIYDTLCRTGNEEKAIQYAKKRFEAHLCTKMVPSEMCPCTTLYELVDKIKFNIPK